MPPQDRSANSSKLWGEPAASVFGKEIQPHRTHQVTELQQELGGREGKQSRCARSIQSGPSSVESQEACSAGPGPVHANWSAVSFPHTVTTIAHGSMFGDLG